MAKNLGYDGQEIYLRGCCTKYIEDTREELSKRPIEPGVCTITYLVPPDENAFRYALYLSRKEYTYSFIKLRLEQLGYALDMSIDGPAIAGVPDFS